MYGTCCHEIAVMQAEELQLLAKVVLQFLLFFQGHMGAAIKPIPNQQQYKVIALDQFFQDVIGLYFNNHCSLVELNLVVLFSKVVAFSTKRIENWANRQAKCLPVIKRGFQHAALVPP
jgi:hypothetical protein